jgi:dTDP-4-amino-4,6-dideoxygalactose transaminase
MNKIRIGDFPLGKDERNAIHRVVESGRISEHREVRAFEEELLNTASRSVVAQQR